MRRREKSLPSLDLYSKGKVTLSKIIEAIVKSEQWEK
jgi:hypothetical protein